MHPVTRLATVTLAALTFSACGASLRVTSYAPAGNDWSGYRTYAWTTVDNLQTGDPRLDNNSIFHERLRAEVDRQLARRGFAEVAGNADMMVRYRVIIADDIESEPVDPVTGYCPDNDCAVYVFHSGTLTFDLTDARTNRTLWAGRATGTVDGVVNDQKRLEEAIGEVVARVFQELPRQSITAGQ